MNVTAAVRKCLVLCLICPRDPQSEKKLTGGANWMPQVAPTSWATPGAPMVRAASTVLPHQFNVKTFLQPAWKLFNNCHEL